MKAEDEPNQASVKVAKMHYDNYYNILKNSGLFDGKDDLCDKLTKTITYDSFAAMMHFMKTYGLDRISRIHYTILEEVQNEIHDL